MNAMRPFSLLLARASVFWLFVFGLGCASVFVLGISQPEAHLERYLDPALISAFGFPLLAGWLAGAAIQEFQHTSFAAVLPRVRTRVAMGFLVAGVAAVVVVTAVIALGSEAPQIPLWLAVGLGGYCLGGVFIDPLSNWITAVNVAVAALVVARSHDLAAVGASHSWATIAVFLGVGTAACWRLFARSTFRRKPWRATAPLPGRFSLERSREVQARRRLAEGTRRSGWRRGYLGVGSWPWVRAALHETHGALTLSGVLRQLVQTWGIALVFAGHAWMEKGQLSFGKALACTIHDAVLRSPHVPRFGEKVGPVLLVVIVLGLLAAINALFAPTVLHAGLAHPLSRRRQARVAFMGGLVDIALLLVLMGGGLFLVGHAAGWFAGYEPRFDYMPFYLRALLIALIFQPLAHRGRLGLEAANRRRAANSSIALVFGLTGFVALVNVGTFVSGRVMGSPLVELVVLVGGLVVSQWAYRGMLGRYFREADLSWA